MTPNQFEREIRNECRTILNNPKLKDEDIMEWATSKEHVLSKLNPETEVYVECSFMHVHCAVLKSADKRK